MIEKERLQELIEQNKEIYFVNWTYKEIECVNKIVIADYIITLEIVNDLLYVIRKEDAYKPEVIWKLKLNELFETKEDAEFALRYKRIPHTEYLDLPDWEEVEGDYSLEFGNSSLEIYKSTNRILVMTNRNYLGLYDYAFDKETTKENYLEACEICRKLWLGEEV